MAESSNVTVLNYVEFMYDVWYHAKYLSIQMVVANWIPIVWPVNRKVLSGRERFIYTFLFKNQVLNKNFHTIMATDTTTQNRVFFTKNQKNYIRNRVRPLDPNLGTTLSCKMFSARIDKCQKSIPFQVRATFFHSR